MKDLRVCVTWNPVLHADCSDRINSSKWLFLGSAPHPPPPVIPGSRFTEPVKRICHHGSGCRQGVGNGELFKRDLCPFIKVRQPYSPTDSQRGRFPFQTVRVIRLKAALVSFAKLASVTPGDAWWKRADSALTLLSPAICTGQAFFFFL